MEELEFEYCTNEEWLRVFGPWATEDGELDGDGFKAFLGKMEALFPEALFIPAQHERKMCHGWNGAQWQHHNGGIGTFCKLTPEQEELFNSI
jgi:hypothetical protein